MHGTFAFGTSVRARGLSWEVIDCDPAGEQTRVRLRCLEGELRGLELDLLHPVENIEPLRRPLNTTNAGRLQHWRLYHEAYLLEQALGSRDLIAVQPGRLDIAPYQLVPVLRALEMGRTRLLLADGVGLGKTVQAGIIITELIARRRAHRVLVVSPAGPLLNQWDKELRTRFGLRFTRITDWGALQEERRKLELGANPFASIAYCLTSIDFAKQEKVLQDLERSSWDLVVIDEAHHCVRLGGAGDREDSQRRGLAELLARQSDGLLLLTATPHDGFDAHFGSLVELLDPSLVDGRGNPRSERYRRHIVRRLKTHIKDPKTGECRFKVRQVTPVPVTFDEAAHGDFRRFQEALLDLVAPRLKRALRQKRYAEVLAFVALLKRSVSSVRACRNTLGVIADRYVRLSAEATDQMEVRRQRLRTLRDYRRRLERYGALTFEEEQDQAVLEAEDMAQEILETGADELVTKLHDVERDTRRMREHGKRVDETLGALQALVELAQRAEGQDPKLPGLLDQLRTIRNGEPNANVLVYTEYTDSQDVILEFLRSSLDNGQLSGAVEAISGRDGDADRTKITERFGEKDGIVLVSTDATAEGLNLHQRCHHLIHLELPYNPNRLEQRNGRIDRYGQERIPLVRYLYLAGTFEERLLLRLVWKYEKQRARMTFMPNTLGMLTDEHARTTTSLLAGLAEEQELLFKRPRLELKSLDQDEEDIGIPAYEEMLAEVERALSGFEKAAKSHAWLADAGLNAEQAKVAAAAAARGRGANLIGNLDLVTFVKEAIEAEIGAGQAMAERPDGALELQLPPDWTFGLDNLPGYDPETRVLRLTRNRERLQDAQGRTLGFLGRAHPLVRRAIVRVRRVESAAGDALLDRRVTAALADAGSDPSLIYTFSAAISSDAGTEYQRIIAATVSRDRPPQALDQPGDWMRYTSPDRQVGTRGTWDRYFSSWARDRELQAQAAVAKVFESLACAFSDTQRAALEDERRQLEQWLQARTADLCGRLERETNDLFAPVDATSPRWKTLTDPRERLAAFAADGGSLPARRREAEGVLSLLEARLRDLDRRGRSTVEAPRLLGMLMLIPADGTA